MDKLVIEISGDLPEKGKHAIIHAAEVAVEAFIKDFAEANKVTLTGSARPVRAKAAATTPGVREVKAAE